MILGLKNKVALVAASSEGLGKASALALSQEGAHVIICSRRREEIRDAAKDIQTKTGRTVLPVVADLTKPSDINRLVDVTRKKLGAIHVLVNNCGGRSSFRMAKSSLTDFAFFIEPTLGGRFSPDYHCLLILDCGSGIGDFGFRRNRILASAGRPLGRQNPRSLAQIRNWVPLCDFTR